MSQTSTMQIVNHHWHQRIKTDGMFKTVELCRQDAASWLSEAGGREFSLFYDDKCLSGASGDVKVTEVTVHTLGPGVRQHAISLDYPAEQIGVIVNIITYDESALIEKWITVINKGKDSIRIDRIDAFSLHLPQDDYELMYYKSGWCLEFGGVRETLAQSLTLEGRQGRSTSDYHPWFTLFRKRDGEVMTGTIAWSGNWILRFEKTTDGGFEISGGLNDWSFHADLAPGQSIESPRVILALGGNGDLHETSLQFARIGRAHWYPKNQFSQSLPVEWNHWWPYEDKSIDEAAFIANVEKAANLGVELCTLDAGWFGPSEDGAFWYDYRGDWHLVNATRFPNGLRVLADEVHRHGMKFGLWCEIEALGQYAKLAEIHPEYVALRDGERIGGYVCFGNPDVQDWAFQILDRLITDNDVDWVKIDFNVDPGAGCNRADHGHGAGDGLYAHYQGYYRVLARIRQQHPDVVFENCSGGGMRLDLGVLKQTHTTFVSDGDWPEHNLQVFWGASTMLAPDVCLHWSYSEWQGNNKHPRQLFDPHDPTLTERKLDYYVRTAMLGGFGFSQKLPELPAWMLARYAHHTQIYKEHVRRFVREADCYRLTAQPKRECEGDRWAAFQYSLSEGDAHLLFVFRLDGSVDKRTIRLVQLDADSTYTIKWLSAEKTVTLTGRDLLETGIRFDDLLEEDSALMLLAKEANP